MNQVAESHAVDRKRYRQYERNRRSDPEDPDVTPSVSYNKDPSDMSDDQIEKQYWKLQRLREDEIRNGDPRGFAMRMSERQMELYNEAKLRGFERKLSDPDRSEYA